MIMCGYDGEGKVFIQILSTIDGKPANTMVAMVPETAFKVAEGIRKAAAEAIEWGKGNERNSPNPN
uniref:Uncharacterized protein n=1 Tax=viral metagenome TaxID=1070528 RepID=A0A6M3KHB4_9ZZZZ